MVIKNPDALIADLEETFNSLRRFWWKLNRTKCIFGLPSGKLLKCQDKFQWTEEAERALQDLKHHLQSPPVLMAPLPGEDLLLYIAATTHVVSSAIVVERSEEGHAFGV
jgi:hypothetical protein